MLSYLPHRQLASFIEQHRVIFEKHLEPCSESPVSVRTCPELGPRGIANLACASLSVKLGLSFLDSGEDEAKARLRPSVGPIAGARRSARRRRVVSADSKAGAMALYA